MVYLASDHGGFATKEITKRILKSHNINYKDLGPLTYVKDDDYPDYVIPLASAVATNQDQGIIACRNGQGAAIVANKVKGIRAAICWNEECARSARNDDDSNILSLPADYLSDLEIEKIVVAWLETPFSEDARHIRRINKIREYETEGE